MGKNWDEELASEKHERLRGLLEETEHSTEELLEKYYLELAWGADERCAGDKSQESGESPERQRLYEAAEREVRELKTTAASLSRVQRKMSAQADELETRLRDVKGRRKRRLIPAAPANSVIDLEEQEKEHFARGINFYKIFIIFFAGCFAGVVWEMLWCLLSNGYVESRSGLVYGPFNLVYGVGAAVLTLALYRYRNRSWLLSFLGGILIGSLVEYVCSWGQETFFGSRSWDYSNEFLNLSGRICLKCSLFWGVLGVWWIKSVYPLLSKWILNIPQRIGKALTWVLCVFMAVNSLVSLAAVTRWSERVYGVEADSALEEFIDERFPDERMERVYPNMEFGESG